MRCHRTLLRSTVLVGVLSAVIGGHTLGAQTITPPSISIPASSAVCSSRSQTQNTCIKLPPGSVVDKVDVFFLFDDTGSFASFVPTVSGIFSALVTDLEAALPGVSFGFGVGRFEDYGGPGTGFSGEDVQGRPFVLNQPIVTAATAGGAAARNTLITSALSRAAAGYGGDGPESAIAEALFQVATGAGFDGDGDGQTTGLDGTQVAGATATQTAADASGDVPLFSTLHPTVPVSGTAGGVGFRTGALRLVILATDICSVAAFDAASGIPVAVVGTGSTEPVSAFACTSTTPGVDRFGYVSDAKSLAANTVAGAVVPAGAGTVPDTVAALNAAGIRVLGMGPGAGPTAATGPSFSEDVFLSALARMTGAVDSGGNPLVFSIGSGGGPLKDAIVDAITSTTTLPIDITLEASAPLPAGLSVGISPLVVHDVGPDGTACFDVTFTGTDSPNGSFVLDFKDVASNAVLGTVPADVACVANQPPACGGAAPSLGKLWPPNHQFVGVSITGVSDPDADVLSITIDRITQDEPLNSLGDGNTCPDAKGLGTATAWLRAERSGTPKVPGNGRVYHVNFTATDPAGTSCSGEVRVCVPHDQRPATTCVDDGATVVSTRTCRE